MRLGDVRRREPEDDPLIDEIRAIRKALSGRFDNDPSRLGEYVNQVGEDFRRRTERAGHTTPKIPHEAA